MNVIEYFLFSSSWCDLMSSCLLQLLLAVCERNSIIGTSCQGSMLPSITHVINLADSHDRAAFAMATHIKQEPRERENSETKEEVRCTHTHTTPHHTDKGDI